MSFKDYFPIDMLLNPPVYFKGTISLYPEEIQSCASKSLEDFIENNYMKKFNDFFRGKTLSPTAQRIFTAQKHMSPSFVYSNCDIDNNELGCRNLRFGTQVIIAMLLHHFYPRDEAIKLQREANEMLTSRAAYDEIAKYIKDTLIRRKNEMQDVKENVRQSVHFLSVKNTIANTGDFVFDISTMLEARVTDFQVMFSLLKKLKSTFATPLNIDEFFESVDYAKFCLLIAAHIIKADNLVPEDYVFIASYLKAIKEYRRSNPAYACSVKLGEENSREYSVEDLEKEFEQHKKVSPEIMTFLAKLDRAKELFRKYGLDISKSPLNTPEGVKKYKQIVQREEQIKTLHSAWEFFPKGHKTKTDEAIEKKKESSSDTPKSEKERRKLQAYEYLEASDYLYKIEGIHQLEGYIGYIYGNGKIIFERFLQNAKTNRVAIDHSTIVIMTLDRLVEISKLSRSAIGAGIRSGELAGEVETVYHYPGMTSWRSKMDQHIAGTEYTSEIIGFLTELIKQGYVRPREVVR